MTEECPALDLAVQADKKSELAMQRIISHENSCGDRYEIILHRLDSMEKKMWGSAISIIVLLTSISVSLIMMYLKTKGVTP